MEDTLEQSEDVTVDAQDEAQEYAPGELAPCIVTTAKVWKSDDLKSEGLLEPIKSLIKSLPGDADMARRFQVLSTWEARLQDRGHTHNSSDGEGWTVAGSPGNDKRNSIAEMNEAGIHGIGVYSAQGDIATGVLNRGKVKVSFSPKRSKRPQDVAAATAANSYSKLWEKNNPSLQKEVTNYAWTDCRSLVWTRTVADKSRFGVDDEGKPLQMEVSSSHGVLETRLPMTVDSLKECSYAQIFCDEDYAVQRATYPWTGKKIKAGGGSSNELEIERIARLCTRTGIGGRIFGSTGDTERLATMVYTWMRPGIYWSENVKDEDREALLSNFQNGIFVVMSGSEVCMAFEASMDDFLSEGMWTRGVGQNRRALGTLDLPISKRANEWAALLDSYFRGAIPMTLLDSQSFDAEAVSELEASPRRFFSVTLDTAAGQTMQSVVGQTPQPAPMQGGMQLFQWYITDLIQSLDGCTPALLGSGEGSDNTVGASLIRLNQSLERYGVPWQTLNGIISRAAWQAAKACGENQESDLDETIGDEDICVSPQALRGGEFKVSDETVGMIPESGAQREAKVSSLLELASQNQQVASIIATPNNAREIVNALHLDDVITIDAADAEDGALETIELLLEAQPLTNPAYVELENQIAQAESTHTNAKNAVVQSGTVPTQDVIEKGQALEAQIQTLQQQLQSTPQYQPSVSVSTDGSEDYATCAATAFSWMQQSTGRTLRRKAEREQPGGENWNKWTNVYLWWSAMKAQADKQSQANPQAPKVSLTGKVSPAAVAQLLSAGGVQVDPTAEQQPSVEQVQRTYGPTSETETRIKAGSNK
jgi:hypothetical protein